MELKLENNVFTQAIPSKIIFKCFKFILDLAHPAGKTEISQYKNITINVHKINKYLLDNRTYSFFPLLQALLRKALKVAAL